MPSLDTRPSIMTTMRMSSMSWLLLCILLVHTAQCLLPTTLLSTRRLACSTKSTQLHAQHDRRHSRNNLRKKQPEEATYVATCIPGLAPLLAEELIELGSHRVETTGNAAVRFTADTRTALVVLLEARIPHKIMELLCTSTNHLQTRNDLYQFVRDTIPVQQVLGDGCGGLLTLSVSTMLNSARYLPTDINHSHYTALTIKNAICDAVRDLRGDRPDVDTDNADVPLVAVLRGGKASDDSLTAELSLFRQVHQGSLHRRGYRPGQIHKAAMKESLAAGLLRSMDWPKTCRAVLNKNEPESSHLDTSGTSDTPSPLIMVDPMAGSGTLILEALFVAADVAPHVLRLKCGLDPVEAQQYPPIVRWKHNDDDIDVLSLWKDLLQQASTRAKQGLAKLRQAVREKQILFVANDVHPGAIDLLQQSLQHAGVQGLVQVTQSDCRELTLKSQAHVPWTVVSNPPWGERLDDDMHESWEALRVFMREHCPDGTVAHLLSGNAQATKHLQLRRSASLPLQVGTMKLRWLTYVMGAPPARAEQPSEDRQQNNHHNNNNNERGYRGREPAKQADGNRQRNNSAPRSAPQRRKVTISSEENEWDPF